MHQVFSGCLFVKAKLCSAFYTSVMCTKCADIFYATRKRHTWRTQKTGGCFKSLDKQHVHRLRCEADFSATTLSHKPSCKAFANFRYLVTRTHAHRFCIMAVWIARSLKYLTFLHVLYFGYREESPSSSRRRASPRRSFEWHSRNTVTFEMKPNELNICNKHLADTDRSI